MTKCFRTFAAMKKTLIILSAVLLLASCKTGAELNESPQYEKQVIELPGVPNARQLGGYIIGNKQIRMDVLLRSGDLSKASDEAVGILQDRYRLALVADFRSSMERGHAPDRDVPGTQSVWFPILEKMIQREDNAVLATLHQKKDDPHFTIELLKQPEIRKVLLNTYDDIVFDEDYQSSYAAFLDSLVALPEGSAALWHCSHGKDRCGCGTAFVLAALGADRDLIIADFEMSNVPYTEEIDELASIARAEDLDDVVIDEIYLLRGVSSKYFEKTLDAVDERYGSMDNFLKQALGLTGVEKRALRKKFLIAR